MAARRKKRRLVLLDCDERGFAGLAHALGEVRGSLEVPATAAARREALAGCDVAVVCARSGSMDGLRRLRQAWPALRLLAVVDAQSASCFGEAFRCGADEVLAWPARPPELNRRLGALQDGSAMDRLLERMRGELESPPAVIPLVTRSRVMRDLWQRALHLATARIGVLISGESGTGKELVARAIHQAGPRRHAPFIPVNCGAIPETLIESELFGHERGAFTGAYERMRGKFEMAHGGTLYLDEIGEMAPATQVKILRALEEGAVVRVGGSEPAPVDLRVVAATNADLDRLVELGRFRSDLFFRLKGATLHLPPLRERPEDVPLLVHAFTREACDRNDLPTRLFTRAAVEALTRYPWPGNIRELKNVVESLCVMAPRERIDVGALPPHLAAPVAPPVPPGEGAAWPVSLNLREVERTTIEAALRAAGGVQRGAARLLGISERTLYRKIRRYGLGGAARRAGSQSPTSGQE